MEKKRLRAELKAVLDKLSKEEFEQKSINLSRKLNELFINLNIQNVSDKIIGGFTPIQKEPLWFSGLESNINLSVVHIKSETELSFHPVSLNKFYEGTLRLRLDNKILESELTPDLVLVPGLGFTKEGERLGRGKGYYDRYLSSFSGVSIGICFEEQIRNDVLALAHDEKVNYVVTDKNIYKGK